MTPLELNQIVEQRMDDPRVLGRIACNLRQSDSVVQRQHDGREFAVSWQDAGDYWRCTLSDRASGDRLAQVDLHENQTVRIEVDAACRVTVSPEDGILSVTRYKGPH
jgi:hypothetical protein